jgi:excisionase family DNA binding protein
MNLLSYTAAARRLSVSTRTVERLVSAGQLATVRVRRARRISDAEIDRYIRAHTSAPRSAVVSPFLRGRR